MEVNETLRGRMNFKGRLLQKQRNSATKLQKNVQICDQKKTSAKNCSKISIFTALNRPTAHFGGMQPPTRDVNEMKINQPRTNENENFLKTWNENEKKKSKRKRNEMKTNRKRRRDEAFEFDSNCEAP